MEESSSSAKLSPWQGPSRSAWEPCSGRRSNHSHQIRSKTHSRRNAGLFWIHQRHAITASTKKQIDRETSNSAPPKDAGHYLPLALIRSFLLKTIQFVHFMRGMRNRLIHIYRLATDDERH